MGQGLWTPREIGPGGIASDPRGTLLGDDGVVAADSFENNHVRNALGAVGPRQALAQTLRRFRQREWSYRGMKPSTVINLPKISIYTATS